MPDRRFLFLGQQFLTQIIYRRVICIGSEMLTGTTSKKLADSEHHDHDVQGKSGLFSWVNLVLTHSISK